MAGLGGPAMPMDPAKRVAQMRAIHGEAAARNAGLPRPAAPMVPPPSPYLGRYAAGGPVPSPTLYAQGGEVDDSMTAKPVLPNMPSMQQPTVGYAQGGMVDPFAGAPGQGLPARPSTPAPVVGKAGRQPTTPKKPKKLNRAERVTKFEQENGDAEV